MSASISGHAHFLRTGAPSRAHSAEILPFPAPRLTDEQHERAFRLSPEMEAIAEDGDGVRKMARRFAPVVQLPADCEWP